MESTDIQGEKGLFFIGKSLKRGSITYIARSSSGKLMARAETLGEMREMIERLKKTGNAATAPKEETDGKKEEKESKSAQGGELKTLFPKKGTASSQIRKIGKEKNRPSRFRGYSFK